MARAKAKSKELPFSVKDYVVYPTHGVGQITDISSEEIAGFWLHYMLFTSPLKNDTQGSSVGKAEELGLKTNQLER